MIAFGSNRVQVSQFLKTGAVMLCLGLAGIGCGGHGGSSSGGAAQPPNVPDPEGTSVGDAIVISADGSNFKGFIDFGGDFDYFTFNAGVGLTYTMQISGYPPDPDLSDIDFLNEGGEGFLRAAIIDLTGTDSDDSIPNSTSTGGQAYNTDPEGFDSGDGIVLGDSRIAWVCPATGNYFIQIGHGSPLVGTGYYDLAISSSQLGITNTGRLQFGLRRLSLSDDNGPLWPPNNLSGWVWGFIQVYYWELPDLDFLLIGDGPQITFIDDDEPQTQAVHFHIGFPNTANPPGSANIQVAPDDPHPFIIAIDPAALGRGSANSQGYSETILRSPDGEDLRIPVTYSDSESILPGSNARVTTIHFGDAVGANRGAGGGAEVGASALRTVIGWDFYLDYHVTDDLEVLASPIAVTPPYGDVYSLFESEMRMSPTNVLRSDGTRLTAAEQRGNPEFDLFYDASLKAFQVARRFYGALDFQTPVDNPGELNEVVWVGESIPLMGTLPADAEIYSGDVLTLHTLDTNGIGAAILDLGTIPPPQDPASFDSNFNLVIEEPGFRNVTRQLNSGEVSILLNAYYTTGITLQLTDVLTGQPLARADALPSPVGQQLGIPPLEISDFQIHEPIPARDEGRAMGTVNFVSDYGAGGPISVASNGVNIGALYRFVEEGALPLCGEYGEADSLAEVYWPNRYPYKAVASDGTTWTGHFEITSGSCETIVLSAE